MSSLVFEGRFTSGQSGLDVGITDLMIVDHGAGPMLYATSGPFGGLTAYDLGPVGSASVSDFAFFDAAWADGITPDLALLDDAGSLSLVFAASGLQQVRAFDLDGNGDFGTSSQLSGLNAGNGRALEVLNGARIGCSLRLTARGKSKVTVLAQMAF